GIREVIGLFRLASIEKLRARAELALVDDDRDSARAIVRDLTATLSATPQLARSRSELQTHLTEIIDGRDLLHIAERGLMAPLDQEASRLVARTATRVSLVTAVSPRAAVDLAFVLFAALGMIRRLAALYGGRPGFLGMIRLVRHSIAHVTVTGTLAAGDSLIPQLLGAGVAAKLSARPKKPSRRSRRREASMPPRSRPWCGKAGFITRCWKRRKCSAAMSS